MRENAPAALQTAATDDSTDLEERDVRALTEYLTVLDDVGRAAGADDMYLVVSQSGSEYLVDTRLGACECADAEYRDPEGGCKHVRRARFATGRRPIPDGVDTAALDDQLGAHVDNVPSAVATDGGTDIIEAGDDGEVLEDDRDAGATGGEVYTYHWEPYEQGGARYVRCELCDAECVPADPDRLAHFEGCPEGRR